MEADLYDEFGNYIGPELESDEESEDEDEIGEEEAAEYVSWNVFFALSEARNRILPAFVFAAFRLQNVAETTLVNAIFAFAVRSVE